MRILIVNSVCGIGSTGRICTALAREFEAAGHEVRIAYGRGQVPEGDQRFAMKIGNRLDLGGHLLKTRLLDAQGLGSVSATRRFLARAEEWKPELLWLHNLHGYYINYELLFAWIKKHPELEVRWTLHDCWAFTGHCAYFTAVGCERWKTCCAHCPQKTAYPSSRLLDRAKRNFKRKRAAFTGVRNMTLITPSRWLAGLVGESFLKEYPVEVRCNTVDTDVFKPTESGFRAEHGLEGKKIVLGVSSSWEEPRKGLKDMYALASLLDRDRFAVVLVGLSDELRKTAPDGVLGLGRTDSPQALAAIYTAADVYVNPTYEDNYPTTNLEAQACGTPVVTYDTGGSPESVPPENVVPCGDVAALAAKIREALGADAP
ncbi:MAG: glycosyltransferase [Oscillospiraceae bacterium]|nr:glycosyltransferase [Oscillospiraceae bacterium]